MLDDDWRGESLIRTVSPDRPLARLARNRCRVCRSEIDPRAKHCHRHKPVHRDLGRFARAKGGITLAAFAGKEA